MLAFTETPKCNRCLGYIHKLTCEEKKIIDKHFKRENTQTHTHITHNTRIHIFSHHALDSIQYFLFCL